MNLLRDLFVDMRKALVGLRHAPGFATTAIVTLALGIGANSAIFTLVDRLLLRPLPLPDAGRLVLVTERSRNDPRGRDNWSYPDFLDHQRGASQLEGMAAFRDAAVNLLGGSEPERVRAGRVSGSFFEVLRTPPALGRGFHATEDQADGPKVVVLTDGLWERRFGREPGIVGRTIRVDGADTLVIGVLPRGFEFPYQLRGAELFLPLALPAEAAESRGSHFLGGVGRLKPGATVEGAAAELRTISARLERDHPGTNRGYAARVAPLQAEVTRKGRASLITLLAAVGFVLLIACANLASLQLARSLGRARERAIRAALGASRGRLVRQALAESLALALLGAAAGLVLSRWALAGLAAASSLGLPGGPGRLDLRVLAFTLVVTLATALLSGLLPALHGSRVNLDEGLREGARGATSPSHRRLQAWLVAAQVALATALLVGAGLMLRSLWNLQRVDPGFEPGHLLVADLSLAGGRYPGGAEQRAFQRRLLDRLGRIPGVEGVAAVTTLPLGGRTTASSYQVRDQASPDGPSPVALTPQVSPGYFAAMRIPLKIGRDLTAADTQAVVVSERLAARHWPGRNPLGGRVSLGGDDGPWFTVVGVVGDVHAVSLSEEPEPTIYFALLDPSDEGRGAPDFTAVLRTPGDPAVLTAALKSALKELDAELPLSRVRTLGSLLEQDRRGAAARGLLLGAFAAVALFLAGLGIYGVTSFLVAQRARETGVRMALGATVSNVLGHVLAHGLRTTAAGAVCGLGAAAAIGRLIGSQLEGVTPLDPLTYLAVVLILGAVSLLASLLPALRAARVDPSTALRTD